MSAYTERSDSLRWQIYVALWGSFHLVGESEKIQGGHTLTRTESGYKVLWGGDISYITVTGTITI
jgi:hypothetical protein